MDWRSPVARCGLCNGYTLTYTATPAQLVKEEKTTLPLFNTDITNTRLLVGVCFFLLHLASRKMQLCSQPSTPLSLFTFADGVYPRGRGNVNLQVAVIDCLGNLITHRDTGVPSSTMLVTWRNMPKKAFNMWRMAGRIEELNLLHKMKCLISQTTAGISPYFMCGDHQYIWSNTRTNRCSLCDSSRTDNMRKLLWGTHSLTGNPGLRLGAVDKVENMQFVQPILHNLNGRVSRFFGISGRALDGTQQVAFLAVLSKGAKRYVV